MCQFKSTFRTFALISTSLWIAGGVETHGLAQVPRRGDAAPAQVAAAAVSQPRVTLGVPQPPLPRVSLGLPQSLGGATNAAGPQADSRLFDFVPPPHPPTVGNLAATPQSPGFKSLIKPPTTAAARNAAAWPPAAQSTGAPSAPPQASGGNPPAPAFDPLDALPPTMLKDLPASPTSGFDPLDALPPAMLEAIPRPPAATEPLPAPWLAPSLAPSISPPSAKPANEPNRFAEAGESASGKVDQGPYFFGVAGAEHVPAVDQQAWQTPYAAAAFSPEPQILPAGPSDPSQEASPYRGKFAVPTQRPWVELWRPLYTSGIYPPAQEWLGDRNLVMPHFMVYGDYRAGVGINRNAAADANNFAQRLNLDMDLRITATERIHAFMGPLDRNGDYTRLDFTDRLDVVDRTDLRLDNLFFEGDAGAMWGGFNDQGAPFDLPFSFGLLPVFYQNGIWANDNVLGAAVALPSKNSPLLKWSNYDATFFWASDQIDSDAYPGDNNAAEFFGSAWFIEAYEGYIEADYAFVHDDAGEHRSYHNVSLAYTRRYFMRVSNSIRYITNFGQSLPGQQRTADGHMLLLENSWISKAPNTVVPYLNLFYGQGATQSLARANNAGGILNNTGINFETDGLTGYPTLDATGVNASGAALGLNLLGADFQHQLILEAAALAANGQAALRNAAGDQYAVGVRYQKPLSNAWIFRTDHMLGYRDNARDLRGSRVELRWKF